MMLDVSRFTLFFFKNLWKYLDTCQTYFSKYTSDSPLLKQNYLHVYLKIYDWSNQIKRKTNLTKTTTNVIINYN